MKLPNCITMTGRLQLKLVSIIIVATIFGMFLAVKSVFANETVHYDFQIGAGFVAEHGAATSIAQNEDVIEVVGEGSFSIHPKSASGGGTIVHKDKDGNVVGSGTWTATRLVTFRSFGTSPAFPPNFEGGRAWMLVHLTPSGGAEEFDALLKITCIIGDVPTGSKEGVQLRVRGGPIFRDELHGDTLFIRK